MNRLLMALVLISVTSCSNKVMYDNLRLNQRQKCAKELRTTYLECIERTNKSYEDYERERKDFKIIQDTYVIKHSQTPRKK